MNPQPTDYKSVAIPIELFRLFMVEDDGLEPPTLTDYKSVAIPIELFRLFMVEDDGLEPPTLCL